MTVMEAIKARKSIRSYDPRPVEEEKLQRVLEAGRLAPSARNAQTWKFVVVKDGELRKKLAVACRNQDQVAQAPVTLIVCGTQHSLMQCGQPRDTVDCSIALSFMVLEAAAQGLGTCWLGAFDAEEVRKVLDLPEEYSMVAVSPLGYPAGEVEPRPRKALDEIVISK